jgi:hypothetical protein
MYVWTSLVGNRTYLAFRTRRYQFPEHPVLTSSSDVSQWRMWPFSSSKPDGTSTLRTTMLLQLGERLSGNLTH